MISALGFRPGRIHAIPALWIALLLFAPSALMAQGGEADRGIRTEAGASSGERRIALVIGNGSYESSPLRNPVNDARAMATALGEVGFEVTAIENADQTQMKRAIDDFGPALRDSRGVGLFYFAGHGMQVEGRNFLIPVGARVDAQQDVEYESVDAGRVMARMDAAGARVNIVILDACRNNPFARSFRSQAKGLAQINAPSGTLVAYATAPGSVAADGEGANGLYTEKLVRHICTPGLTIETVFKRVREGVQSASNRRQTP